MSDVSFTIIHRSAFSFFFFFNDTATTEIYTLSLHDALPISVAIIMMAFVTQQDEVRQAWNDIVDRCESQVEEDRKSTRLNSSHDQISYAVFCLKKKKNNSMTALCVRLRADALHLRPQSYELI